MNNTLNSEDPTSISKTLETIVHKRYIEIEDLTLAEGAQFWNGKWWLPVWGCDTLQYMLEDVEYVMQQIEDN